MHDLPNEADGGAFGRGLGLLRIILWKTMTEADTYASGGCEEPEDAQRFVAKIVWH